MMTDLVNLAGKEKFYLQKIKSQKNLAHLNMNLCKCQIEFQFLNTSSQKPCDDSVSDYKWINFDTSETELLTLGCDNSKNLSRRVINPLSTSRSKWSNKLKEFVGNCQQIA